MERLIYIAAGAAAGWYVGGKLADSAIADRLGPQLDRLRQAVGAELPQRGQAQAAGALAGAGLGWTLHSGNLWPALVAAGVAAVIVKGIETP